MDLLPHIESVSVTRVGAFGYVYNKLYRTKDLEYVPFHEVGKKENYFTALSGYYFDRDLVFRCKKTNDYLLFDVEGVWDFDGLNHELLN